MKIKAIASAFKRNKHLIIYTTPNGGQWIGNGNALYSMEGMPELTAEQVLQMFDVPEEKRADWFCDTMQMPEFFCRDDFCNGTEFKQLKTALEIDGNTLLLFESGGEIYAFNERLLSPLYDEIETLLYYHTSWVEYNGKRNVALVCNSGLFTKAIIIPYKLGENAIKELEALCRFFRSPAHHLMCNPPLKVDPETGEVLTEDSEQYRL